MNQNCKKKVPVEGTCIVLGNSARFFTRRGFAQYKTQQELLEILEMARNLKLTHITDNIRNKPTFICNCCRCCCEIMAGIQAGYFDGVAKTSFIARIDPKKCDYCGSCFTTCNVNAIGLAAESRKHSKAERVSEVHEKICLGCGACVDSCDKQAIYLAHSR